MAQDRPVHLCTHCRRVRVVTRLRSFDVPRYWCSYCQGRQVFVELAPQPQMNRMRPAGAPEVVGTVDRYGEEEDAHGMD